MSMQAYPDRRDMSTPSVRRAYASDGGYLQITKKNNGAVAC